MKKCITWIVFFSFCSFILFGNTSLLYAQQKSKQTIAVLNMEARGGVSTSGAQTLSDRLRSELVNLGVLTVLERGQMYSILQEQVKYQLLQQQLLPLQLTVMHLGLLQKCGLIYSSQAVVL